MLTIDLHDDFLGWRLRPDLRNHPVVGHTVVNSNSMGIRGIEEYDRPIQAGKKRAFFLGDSFVFGLGVNDDETISAHTSVQSTSWEILNIGNHAYGHDQAVMLFDRLSESYQAHVAVLGFVAWDIERNVSTFSYYAKPMLRKAPMWSLVGIPVPAPTQIQERAAWRPAMLTTALLIGESLDSTLREELISRDVTREILRRFVKLCRAKNIVPAILYLADRAAVRAHRATGQESAIGAWLQSVCREEGILCASNESLLTQSEPSTIFLGDGHYSSAGNKLSAQALSELLGGLSSTFRSR